VYQTPLRACRTCKVCSRCAHCEGKAFEAVIWRVWCISDEEGLGILQADDDVHVFQREVLDATVTIYGIVEMSACHDGAPGVDEGNAEFMESREDVVFPEAALPWMFAVEMERYGGEDATHAWSQVTLVVFG
jgi:hypothetical protein